MNKEGLPILITSWWNENDHIERLRQFYEITNGCLKNLTENETINPGHRIFQEARNIMGWLVSSCVSYDWLGKYYDSKKPYNEIPLQYIAGVEIITARHNQMPADLKMPPQDSASDIVGARLIFIEQQDIKNEQTYATNVAETGWIEETTINEMGKVGYNLEFHLIKEKLTANDWKRLETAWTAKKKYLAIGNQVGHPLNDDNICLLLNTKLENVSIVRYDLMEKDQKHHPLEVNEGELIAHIGLFLEMIEDYENS